MTEKYNDFLKKYKRTNSVLENTTQKAKDWVAWTSLKTEDKLMYRVSSSCSTGVTRAGTLVQYICVMLWLCDNASWKCQFTSWTCQFISEISISLTKIWSSQLIIWKYCFILKHKHWVYITFLPTLKKIVINIK